MNGKWIFTRIVLPGPILHGRAGPPSAPRSSPHYLSPPLFYPVLNGKSRIGEVANSFTPGNCWRQGSLRRPPLAAARRCNLLKASVMSGLDLSASHEDIQRTSTIFHFGPNFTTSILLGAPSDSSCSWVTKRGSWMQACIGYLGSSAWSIREGCLLETRDIPFSYPGAFVPWPKSQIPPAR